jgi:hypothetical protein
MRTVFIDEADLIWKQATKDDGNGDLQALINGGYRRGMCNIVRCIGPHHTPTEFDAFSPVVLAGVGDCIPEGVLTRSIIFRMRRKLPTEKLEPYKPRAEAKTQKEIRQRLEAWATVNTTPVAEATPDMPPGLGDRHCEIWEPLVSVADSLKGRWPEAVRKACEALTLSAKARQSSLGVRLLGDIRSIFAKVLPNQYGEKAIHSKDLTDWLVSGNNLDADSPWASLKGFPLSVRYLATLLARYEIRPEKITLGAHTLQGYYEKAFAESWVRYLTPFSASPESPESPESNGMAAMVGMVPQRKSMCEACADDRPGECSRRTMQGSCWAQKHPEMLS